MADFRIVALGVGDYCSAVHYSTSLAAVAPSGDWLLIDCPHPIRKILREASEYSGVELPLTKLVGVALTHLHADHASGLEGLGYFRFNAKLTPKALPLIAGPKVAAAFAKHSEAAMFDIRPCPPGETKTVGPFEISTHDAHHGSMDCYAMKVKTAGRTFAHSADTLFYPDLLDWLIAADLMTHELGADPEMKTSHTSYGQLLAWTEKLPGDQAKKVLAIHYPDSFDTSTSLLQPARQGWVYRV